MQRRFLFGASTSPTHSKWNHSIGQPGISQAIILPHSGPLQRHQNSFPAVATLSLDFCRAVLCFLEAAAFFFTSTNLSSLPYRVNMCYPHFNVFSTQKGVLCKFLNRLSIALAKTAFFVSLNQILRSILPISANMDGGNDNVQSIYFATNLGTSHFQPQSNLPDSPRWGHIKKQSTSYLPPRGTDL